MKKLADAPLTTEQKYDLVATPVTLDGKKAAIRGALNAYATVVAVDRSGAAAQFSWSAVARVVANGGRFMS